MKNSFLVLFFLGDMSESLKFSKSASFLRILFFCLADEDYLSYFCVEQQSQWVMKLEAGVEPLRYQALVSEPWDHSEIMTFTCLPLILGKEIQMSYSLESRIGEVIAWILDLEDMAHLHILIQKPHILIFAFWKTNGSGNYSWNGGCGRILRARGTGSFLLWGYVSWKFQISYTNECSSTRLPTYKWSQQ